MMKMIKGTLVAAAVVASMATAGAANAQLASTTFTPNGTSVGSPSPTSGYSVVQNFDSCAVGTSTSCAGMSGSYNIYNGNVPGNGTTPFTGDTTNYLSVLAGQVATYTFGAAAKVSSVQFDWGTVASTDLLQILTSDGKSTSFSVPTAVNPGALYQQNGLFVATATSGTYITGLVFSASQNSFEVDNIAVATPEPATWGMMILGFGMIGGVMRRRSTKASVRFA